MYEAKAEGKHRICAKNIGAEALPGRVSCTLRNGQSVGKASKTLAPPPRR
jgi:hypothetical protein